MTPAIFFRIWTGDTETIRASLKQASSRPAAADQDHGHRYHKPKHLGKRATAKLAAQILANQDLDPAPPGPDGTSSAV